MEAWKLAHGSAPRDYQFRTSVSVLPAPTFSAHIREAKFRTAEEIDIRPRHTHGDHLQHTLEQVSIIRASLVAIII